MDFSGLLSADFVNGLFEIIIQVIMAIVSILLLPFSVIINTYMPSFDDALSSLATTFGYALTYMGWIISAFAIPMTVIVAMVGYYTFVVFTKMAAWGAKLGLSWYRAFK